MNKIYVLISFLFFSTVALNAQVEDVVLNLDEPFRLLRSGNTLYFSEADRISKINITDSNPVPVTVVDGLFRPQGMALDGNSMYIAEFDGGRIVKIDVTDPDPIPQLVLSGLNSPNVLLLDGNMLYVTDINEDSIYRLDISDPFPVKITLVNDNNPIGLALSGTDLYYSKSGQGTIMKADLTQNPPTTVQVASGFGQPNAMRIAANELYVAEPSSGRVGKIALDVIPATRVEVASGVDGATDVSFDGSTMYIVMPEQDKIAKTEVVLSVEEVSILAKAQLFPNPSSSSIQLSPMAEPVSYIIYNTIGQEILRGKLGIDDQIDVAHLLDGVYLIQFERKKTFMFVKN